MSVSPLQLRSFFLDELSVRVNPDYVAGSANQHGRIEVSPSGPEARGDGTFVLRLQVSVRSDEGHHDGLPYRVVATVRGVFTLAQEKAADESGTQLLLYNGSALLLGQIRAQVAQVTSLSEHGTMWIPVLNLVDLFGRENEAESEEADALASIPPRDQAKTPRRTPARKTTTTK